VGVRFCCLCVGLFVVLVCGDCVLCVCVCVCWCCFGVVIDVCGVFVLCGVELCVCVCFGCEVLTVLDCCRCFAMILCVDIVFWFFCCSFCCCCVCC